MRVVRNGLAFVGGSLISTAGMLAIGVSPVFAAATMALMAGVAAIVVAFTADRQ